MVGEEESARADAAIGIDWASIFMLVFLSTGEEEERSLDGWKFFGWTIHEGETNADEIDASRFLKVVWKMTDVRDTCTGSEGS
jgi:hypothetical protein